MFSKTKLKETPFKNVFIQPAVSTAAVSVERQGFGDQDLLEGFYKFIQSFQYRKNIFFFSFFNFFFLNKDPKVITKYNLWIQNKVHYIFPLLLCIYFKLLQTLFLVATHI